MPTYSQLASRSRQANLLNTVLVELTYGCNLDCVFCYNDLALKGRRVSLARYRSLIDELAEMQVLRLTLSGGEPLMYPDFFEVGAYAKDKGFLITVKSNGLPLNRRNAERLKAEVDPFNVETSLHGASPDTHDRQTRVVGSFERLLRNIEILRSLEIRVNINATLTRWNEHEVEQMYALADRLRTPLRFNAEVSPRDDGDLSPLAIAPTRAGLENLFRHNLRRAGTREKHDRLQIESPEAGTPSKQKICGSGSTYLAIDPFGNVYPCVQFRRRAGNIHEASIRDIWETSQTLREVRDLAVRAVDAAQAVGVKHFCMGLAEAHRGDPLAVHTQAVDKQRAFKRIRREESDPS